MTLFPGLLIHHLCAYIGADTIFDYITGVVAALLASKHEEWLPSYKGDDLKYWSISQHKNVTQLYGGRIFNLTSANGERCDNFGSLQKVCKDSQTIYNFSQIENTCIPTSLILFGFGTVGGCSV